MSLYENIVNKKDKISLIGLGYVGMPIAIAFGKKADVIGFDLNKEKINLYKSGIDPTNEVGNKAIEETTVEFTSNSSDLRQAKFHIVAVPTPVNEDHTPNLTPIIEASKIVGKNLLKGSIVVFESTVYPGVTEDICIPLLEQESGLICGEDFKVGYSPERINPGDKEHRLENIVKVVSGMDEDSLENISKVYELVVEAGVFKADSIKVAEAAKVIENSQRDINIAFMNELSMIFQKLNIDTQAVLSAAGTKWNFLNFTPGLVGGHCIGVDPYYLTHKAEQVGYHSQIILSGRRINDSMGKYITDEAIKLMIKNKINVSEAKVGIFGFTFKENCPDTRNTKVIDIINEFKEYGVDPLVHDPEADQKETKELYDINLVSEEEMTQLDILVVAVNHEKFMNNNLSYWTDKLNDKKIIMDIKGFLDKTKLEKAMITYWRL
ncbi:nucleotide sugar dehydrogenase [Enterococcus casseliflavus]|nr:nucleotide sugar dehydrogenase [Enterococcus casseliflavus]